LTAEDVYVSINQIGTSLSKLRLANWRFAARICATE